MNRMYGLTIAGTDDTDDGVGINLNKLVAVLEQLPVKPTLRISMDFDVQPKFYFNYVKTLRDLGYPIMLQPVDSEAMHRYSIAGYQDRFYKSMLVMGNYVDIVECANEVNGDWCGPNAYSKMDIVLRSIAPSFKKAITFYVTQGYEKAIEQSIITNVIPSPFNYLFYSLYPFSEVQAANFSPSKMRQETSFEVGIGEYGSENSDGTEGPFGAKAKLIQDFETMPLIGNNILGGFYWDFYDDCVKNETGILEVFKSVWK